MFIAGPGCPRWLALHFPKPWWLRRLPGPSLDGNPVFWRVVPEVVKVDALVWMMYWAMGVLWIFLTLQAVSSAGTNHEVIAIMNTFQVALGLLLLSVHAATSLLKSVCVAASTSCFPRRFRRRASWRENGWELSGSFRNCSLHRP